MKNPFLKLICFVLLCVMFCALHANATYVGSSPNLPPLNGAYQSQPGWNANYGLGIKVADVSFYNFSQAFTPPELGASSLMNFSSNVLLSVSMDNGATYTPYFVAVGIIANIYGDSKTGNTFYYNTEMYSVSIFGGLPPGVLIRESPTLASNGLTIIEDLGNGTYRIDSFFDVFTELSFTGGATWLPDQSAPAHITLIPEPATIAILALGALILRKPRA